MSESYQPKEFINRTVILNETNIVPGTKNTRMTYRFNEPLRLRDGDK